MNIKRAATCRKAFGDREAFVTYVYIFLLPPDTEDTRAISAPRCRLTKSENVNMEMSENFISLPEGFPATRR
jgi:hypothetical protein